MNVSFKDTLSRSLPGYEHRPSQDRMAGAVAVALNEARHLIVEAGTGTGKSLAYLIPLAEHAVQNDVRTVVSTYTKALQRQLVEKDLPFVRDSVLEGLRFCASFGSENYLCLRRLERAAEQGLLHDAGDMAGVMAWASETATGLRAETDAGPFAWQQVSRQSDLCLKRDCPHFGRCFYQRAKEKERHAHIIVVNHSLFFTNMATGGKVLPEFGVAVFDEAHELEDVAASFLGLEISSSALRHLADSILGGRGGGLLGRLKWLEKEKFDLIASAVDAMRLSAKEFFAELDARLSGPALRIRQRGFIENILHEPLVRVASELGRLVERSLTDEERAEIEAVASRCSGAATALEAILGQELEDSVYWAERAGRTLRLAASPIDVGPILGPGLFGEMDAAVLTSATLATAGNFSFIRERLGIEDARELLLPSPFDFPSQALLYVASDLPEPNTPEGEAGVIERTASILDITGGGTLVLFTSHRMLHQAAEAISPEGIEILRQGEADSYSLIEEFKNGPAAAVFGTHTFWQGVDVPGRALRCVIITKLPFAVPDEPQVEARMESLRNRNIDPFSHYQLPRAAILLKQGFGRLIRTASDRGVAAVLDPRLLRRAYGRVLRASLPQCKITTEIGDIQRFFDSAGD